MNEKESAIKSFATIVAMGFLIGALIVSVMTTIQDKKAPKQQTSDDEIVTKLIEYFGNVEDAENKAKAEARSSDKGFYFNI